MSQHHTQKQLLQMIGEQLARIMELEERLSFAEKSFIDLAKQGNVSRTKR